MQDIVHVTGWEVNYRSDKPSVSITAHRSFTIIYTYATDTERDIGNIFTQNSAGKIDATQYPAWWLARTRQAERA